jgi:ABC-type nickel/cobalt efflux system permease component RcnA
MSSRQLLALPLLLLAAASAPAHPVPRDNHDRTLVVRLTPDAVVVDYRLEVDEYRATRDLPAEELEGVTDRKDFHAAFTRYHAGFLGNNLVARLDGKLLEFTCVYQRYQLLDHVRCDFRFRAPWKLSADKPHRFTFRESNYELDGFSTLHLSLDASPHLTLRDVVAPDEALLSRPPDKRQPGDADRIRKASATVLAVPSFLPGMAHPALPPDPEPPRPAAPRRLRGIVGQAKPLPTYPVGVVKVITRAAVADPVGVAKVSPGAVVAEAFLEKLVPMYPVGSEKSTPPPSDDQVETDHPGEHSLLHLLLDTRKGLALLLLLAAGFGAAHALTPGHGKTLVAAYLIGQRGTVGHALVLGLVTTLTHTGGVIILAILLAVSFRGVSPSSVQTALALIGGLLIAGLGLWLLLQRLTGRADHVHLGGGHHHHHDEPALATEPQAGWWQIILLGITGGIIPCWDAIAMLLLAISAQRLWLAVPLLLAFSAGLAGVLVLLGIAVVRAGEAARTHFGEGETFKKIVRALPILSAAVITALGLFLSFAAVRSVP